MTLFDRAVRYALGRADLALLKEGAVFRRYAKDARNPRAYCDTVYESSDVISREDLNIRLLTLRRERPLRLVYCGRLVQCKRIEWGIRMLREVRQRGAFVELDIIGDGPERGCLVRTAEENGVRKQVRFLGPMRYGSQLLKVLSKYDAMFFTTDLEDTPRMVFDGYAAGLPIIACAIPFIQDRAQRDGAAIVIKTNDLEGGADRLCILDAHREELAFLARKAREAGEHHAADHWHRRRVDWIVEAVERHRSRRRLASMGSQEQAS